jgi:ElaB/YqjD/DUF883 family membrane-anchored ribosome-binding protein
MADVTTTFAAKDESFAKTVDKLQGRLTGFSGGVESFNSKVAGMASSFAKFAGPIAGVATAFFGAKAAVESFGSALAMGGRLDDLSKRTGASAGEMLLLEKAFELAGSSAEAVGPTISKLNRFLAEASVAGSAQDETLKGLGLSYQRLSELSPTEQMKLLAESIAGIQNPAMQTQAAMAVFGKAGGELIPLLTDFSGELSKARGFLGSLPGIMTENAAAFADLDDNIREVRNKFDQFVAGLITGLVPALTSVTDKLANLDAAGLGQAFSNYITGALQAAADSYLLGDAIDNVKTAIEAIVSGNYSGGLSLMWVTMKITALNAVNEIVKNFTAGLQTIGNFMARMFDPSGALIMLIKSIGTIVSSSLLSKIGSGLADLLSGLGPMFASAAQSARYNAETATRSVEMNMKSLGSQIELVGEQATEAGKALPASFAENKAALNPLFDLTDEFAEQKALQESITASIVEAQSPIESLVVAAKDFRDALFDVPTTLKSVVDLSGELFTNLNNAAIGAQNVGKSFELGADSSGQIDFDLNNSSASANQASNFLAEGAAATNMLDINGRSYADSAAAAANNLKNGRADAESTANTFNGMSDRMAKGANAVNQSIDKIREAHHFGQQTQKEIQQKLEAGGASIHDATTQAAKQFTEQAQLSSEMRKGESDFMRAENNKDRALQRAADMERRGQDGAANNLRRRTEEKYIRELDQISPGLKDGAKQAEKMLGDAGKNSGDNVKDGGEKAGDALKDGAKAIEDATSGGGGGGPVADPMQQALNDIHKFLKDTFFKDFKKRLPQNALS